MYGEPDPGKLPTGSMTTFAPSRRRFGKEKSRSSNMSNKVCPRPPLPRTHRAAPCARAVAARSAQSRASARGAGGRADVVQRVRGGDAGALRPALPPARRPRASGADAARVTRSASARRCCCSGRTWAAGCSGAMRVGPRRACKVMKEGGLRCCAVCSCVNVAFSTIATRKIRFQLLRYDSGAMRGSAFGAPIAP
jgi:hypothetical protein